jgi:hypothetical protein
MMRYILRRLPFLCLVLGLLALPALAGCGAATPAVSHVSTKQPTATATAPVARWNLIWLNADSDRSDAPQAAYASSALAQSPDGALHTPSAAWWLAIGPNFGLVVVQLDPGDHFLTYLPLTRGGPLGPNWLPTAYSVYQRPAPGQSAADATVSDTSAICQGIDAQQSPSFDAMFCPSATHFYMYGRFNLQAKPPTTGATFVTLAGYHGWLQHDGPVTSAVVPLPNGATFVYGGDDDPAQIQTMAATTLSRNLADLMN